ncbi:SDR family oxidoreductase [Enterobacteriaceae bacterium H20N1]|uniref:SDR family oxidoreductase n=1 Tax=Dryocola boscaweniae TaxID=2925397 RepID=A0A9X2WA24_9ENTR|nr:SDR family oxidoreductase [Dryocola boscaweniae]MCT4703665.1 SDR family oxidoreductase [Dryocola boscaweniae]MCT4720833.1 SDR family oxidoreductase [Dryocola boscaweniae]
MAVVVITGGTAGVGRATALRFAKEGYDVAVIARGEKGLRETVAELQATGVRAAGFSADVADAVQIARTADSIEAELGPVSVWINSAMCTIMSPFEDIDPNEYKRVTDVTYLGTVNGTREALRLMTPRNKGTIVQIGSALAYRSIPLQSAYCGAKAAIRGFTDALRCELIYQRSAIRLTMVHLPGTNTPQFGWARNKLGHPARPVAPVYQPEAIAKAIFNATCHAPRETWVGKATVQSILGNYVFPQWLDNMLAKKAWSGQMENAERLAPHPDNLFIPVEGQHQSRGRFSKEAKESVISINSATPVRVAFAAVGLGALILFKKYQIRRKRN